MEQYIDKRIIDTSPIQDIFELLYLTYLALIVWMALQYFTVDKNLVNSWTNEQIELIRRIGLGLVIFKAAADKSWKWICIIVGALVFIAYTRNYLRIEQTYTIEIAILIIGAKGTSFERIAKVCFIVGLTGVIWTLYKTFTGQIEDLIFVQGNRRPRHSFGFVYSTNFAAICFFLCATYTWIRERRITFWEIAILICIALFVLYFCDAKNSAGCIILLAGGLSYVKIRRLIAYKGYREYKMAKWFCILMTVFIPLCATGIILLSYFYNPNIIWMSYINKLLNSRLSLGNKGFNDYYAFTWFGQYIKMVGASITPRSDYFWLDSSYVNILLRRGIIILLLCEITLIKGATQEIKQSSWERLGIIVIISLHCTIEHHLINIAYHPFLLLLFASSSLDKSKSSVFFCVRRICLSFIQILQNLGKKQVE